MLYAAHLILAGMSGTSALAIDIAGTEDIGTLALSLIGKLNVLQVVVAIALEDAVALTAVVGRYAGTAIGPLIMARHLSHVCRVSIQQLRAVG